MPLALAIVISIIIFCFFARKHPWAANVSPELLSLRTPPECVEGYTSSPD